MAQPVYLWLEIDDNAIEGESRITSMDRDGTIECSSFECELTTPREAATGALTGRRQHRPLTVVKRIDKATPLLLKALCMNETVTKAEFRFYRPKPAGREREAEEHFYTVLIEQGYVSDVSQVSEDAVVGGKAAPPMMEEVSFVFQDITWTYEIGGATHTDSWSGE